MEQRKQSEKEEMWMLMRQIGFGAVMGIVFLIMVYLGGLLAHLVSGM